MSRSKRYLILVIVFVVFFLIGALIQEATGFKAIMPLVVVPVAALWFYLFPGPKKK